MPTQNPAQAESGQEESAGFRDGSHIRSRPCFVTTVLKCHYQVTCRERAVGVPVAGGPGGGIVDVDKRVTLIRFVFSCGEYVDQVRAVEFAVEGCVAKLSVS